MYISVLLKLSSDVSLNISVYLDKETILSVRNWYLEDYKIIFLLTVLNTFSMLQE